MSHRRGLVRHVDIAVSRNPVVKGLSSRFAAAASVHGDGEGGTDGERQVALDWAEALTGRSDPAARGRACAAAKRRFTGQELARLTLAIVAIDAWRRAMAGNAGCAVESEGDAR
jgi:alkylhydroperoxidase family enzyme